MVVPGPGTGTAIGSAIGGVADAVTGSGGGPTAQRIGGGNVINLGNGNGSLESILAAGTKNDPDGVDESTKPNVQTAGFTGGSFGLLLPIIAIIFVGLVNN